MFRSHCMFVEALDTLEKKRSHRQQSRYSSLAKPHNSGRHLFPLDQPRHAFLQSND